MTRCFVVDASVIVKCLLPEEDSSYAIDLYADTSYELLAPDFLLLEVTNAVWKKIRYNHIRPENIVALLNEFKKNIAIQFFPFAEYIDRAFNIAQIIGHNSIYDCLYSALAEEQNCPLITADLAYISKISQSNLTQKSLTLTQIVTH